MTSTELVRLVMRRELVDRVRNKAFIITTVISMLVIVAIIVAPTFFDDDAPPSLTIGVTADAAVPTGFDQSLSTTAAATNGGDVSVVDVADLAAAEDAVAEGDVDGVLVGDDTLVLASPDGGLEQLVAQALQAANLSSFLADSGVDPTQLQQASAFPDLTIALPDGKDASDIDTQFGLGFLVTVLLFVTLQINGASLLTTTVEEKSSRVVEVLLGTLRPWQLLAGKLIAMTILSVGQLLLYASGALLAFNLVGDLELPTGTPAVAVTSILMFLVGFGLFAAIYAVAGALANSAEEAQSSAAPIGFVSVAVYMSVIIGVVPSPNGLFAQVLTFIPFSAPFAVPVRAASGIPLWQVAVAFAATAIGTVLVVRLAGRLYSAAVLAGGKLTWRDAFRAEPIS